MIHYIDRSTKKEEEEQVYGGGAIRTFYGNGCLSQILYHVFLPFVTKNPLSSRLYGAFQKSRLSKRKVVPFIEKFQVDAADFLDPVDSFQSFNDFFIRKLKPSSRPISIGNDVAVLPADGRYLVYQDIEKADGFWIKGKKFSLEKLLNDPALAEKYRQGSMVLARLCPVDYHRFHFPCNGIPEAAQPMNGPLYSVNPLALKKNIEILCENKRVITPFHTKNFGAILYIEVGATYVGSIHQTFIAGEPYAKGDEKGYFSFGGSSLIILFEPNRIQFDQDLLESSQRKIETRGFMGQSLGRSLSI